MHYFFTESIFLTVLESEELEFVTTRRHEQIRRFTTHVSVFLVYFS